jgi:hypothetical protein
MGANIDGKARRFLPYLGPERGRTAVCSSKRRSRPPRPFTTSALENKIGIIALMPPIALEQFGEATGALLDLLESIVHLPFQSRLDFLVCCSQSIAAAWTGSYLK